MFRQYRLRIAQVERLSRAKTSHSGPAYRIRQGFDGTPIDESPTRFKVILNVAVRRPMMAIVVTEVREAK
jgi:hypothetical protein